MKVFAINGISLSGKDSFCNMVREVNAINKWNDPNVPLSMAMRKHGDEVQTISTIDPIKEIYTEFFGWDGGKTPEHRKNLNTLKLIWIEASNGPSKWLRETLGHLNSWDTDVDIVFIMVREFDEMMTAVEIGKEVCGHAETIQLVREGIPIPPVEQEFLDSHPKDYVYDWTIINPTVENFPKASKLKVAAANFLYLINNVRLNGRKYNPVVWNPVDDCYVEWIAK